MHANSAVTVLRPIDEVYGFWRDFGNFPQFMQHVLEVKVYDDTRSHWRAAGPAGKTVEWDAIVTEERPDELIAWQSAEGADVANRGVVRFSPAPGDRGTEVRVEIEYTPPGGPLGTLVAKLFGEEPQQQVDDDLRRFKQVMEVGEVVRSEGTPDGAHTAGLLEQHPGQPLTEDEARNVRP
ncbi:MAG: hypothetical protein QOI54_2564 [Actinomycetota bacterium]|jgi:uncharacterized membrane protein|nr:hypothetical protein [Actinomycetota bacterium]